MNGQIRHGEREGGVTSEEKTLLSWGVCTNEKKAQGLENERGAEYSENAKRLCLLRRSGPGGQFRKGKRVSRGTLDPG